MCQLINFKISDLNQVGTDIGKYIQVETKKHGVKNIVNEWRSQIKTIKDNREIRVMQKSVWTNMFNDEIESWLHHLKI